MNVNPSERRGTVFSAFTLCDDLGKGLGPSIASGLHKGGRLHLLYISILCTHMHNAHIMFCILEYVSHIQILIRLMSMLSF